MSDWQDPAGEAAGNWNDSGAQASEWTEPGAATTSFGGETNGDLANGFSHMNMGGGGQEDAGGDSGAGGACRNCGQEGHFARECPEPRKMTCFNCGKDGHSKAECTEPRVFKGECRICKKEGHPASECPDKPPAICRKCKQEGHIAFECKNPMAINNEDVPDKSEDEAWQMLEQASKEKDITDFKDAVRILSKAVPEMTYPRLEKELRKRNMKIYIIAMEKEIGLTYTNVNLQGETGKKFVIGYYLSEKAQRPNLAPKWPTSPEENLTRLGDAGVPMDCGVPLCNNCGELGHMSKVCPQERMEHERVKVVCALCGEDGHRVRDCTQERKKPGGGRPCRICESTEHLAAECPNKEKRACRNCGSEDHMAKECPDREKRTCRNCGSEDHMARDCDQPKDMTKMQCRNCDEMGHGSRDCPKPKDWSKHKCSVCSEMGHGPKRCPQNTGDGAGAGPGTTDNAAAAGWTNNDTANVSANNDWENAGNAGADSAPAWAGTDSFAAPPAVTGGGW